MMIITSDPKIKRMVENGSLQRSQAFMQAYKLISVAARPSAILRALRRLTRAFHAPQTCDNC